MGYSHHHARLLWRRLCPQALLYTEMFTAAAVIHNDRLLSPPAQQQPVALQLAGNDAAALARAAVRGEEAGYAEINLNCGCPSPRVRRGAFGACLMATPSVVAAAVAAMKRAVSVPVTVKCRLAIDDMDADAGLDNFIAAIQNAGVDAVIVHARRAWLKGLNPAQNRTTPPLDYARVRRLKQNFPALPIILNGGVQTVEEAAAQLSGVDGVMLGRAVCRHPYLLAAAAQRFYGDTPPDRREVLLFMLDYVRRLPAAQWRRAVAPLARLYHGAPDNKLYRRLLATPTPAALQQLEQQWG